MSEDNHSDRPEFPSETFRPSSPSGHDINRARQAAEALFAPKKRIADPIPDSTDSPQQNGRKPRILSAVREQQPAIAAARREPTKQRRADKTRKLGKRVPASYLARVRTWLTYGMTIDQAADVCGVSVSEIERIMQKA